MQQPVDPAARSAAKKRKAFWTKQFYLWHWVSSAICLAAMLGFAVTGITLNHAQDIPAKPETRTKEEVLPADLRSKIAFQDDAERKAPLPAEVNAWLAKKMRIATGKRDAEWSELEIYVSLPRPGGDAWLAIDRETGMVHYETTSRGVISYLNDLHKGRHTGPAWAAFLDVFSVACIVFCLTGLGLLWVHARRRPSTWPVVLAGILLPVAIVIFFVH